MTHVPAEAGRWAWIATSDRLPSDEEEVLVIVEGEYHIAAVVGDATGEDLAFMDVHSSDVLPWPSHWASLPPPPVDTSGILQRACRSQAEL